MLAVRHRPRSPLPLLGAPLLTRTRAGGVGGPAREIARFAEVHVTGINNNQYQVTRANEHTRRLGMESMCSFVKGDFMHSTLRRWLVGWLAPHSRALSHLARVCVYSAVRGQHVRRRVPDRGHGARSRQGQVLRRDPPRAQARRRVRQLRVVPHQGLRRLERPPPRHQEGHRGGRRPARHCVVRAGARGHPRRRLRGARGA